MDRKHHLDVVDIPGTWHLLRFVRIIVLFKCMEARLLSLTLLPRDAMRKRGPCCRSVSVCRSITLMHSIHTAEDIVKLFGRPGSPIILVFEPQRWYPIPRWRHEIRKFAVKIFQNGKKSVT